MRLRRGVGVGGGGGAGPTPAHHARAPRKPQCPSPVSARPTPATHIAVGLAHGGRPAGALVVGNVLPQVGPADRGGGDRHARGRLRCSGGGARAARIRRQARQPRVVPRARASQRGRRAGVGAAASACKQRLGTAQRVRIRSAPRARGARRRGPPPCLLDRVRAGLRVLVNGLHLVARLIVADLQLRAHGHGAAGLPARPAAKPGASGAAWPLPQPPLGAAGVRAVCSRPGQPRGRTRRRPS